jgi:hypothetical protein
MNSLKKKGTKLLLYLPLRLIASLEKDRIEVATNGITLD